MTTNEITETPVAEVKVGDVRQYNQGTATIVAIVRESPRSLWYRISYRNDTATLKTDGQYRHNSHTQRTRGFVPIVSDPVAPCCDGTERAWDGNFICTRSQRP